MQLIYDKAAPIGILGLTPWEGLGLNKWFSNCTIASLHDWGGFLGDAPHAIWPTTKEVIFARSLSEAMQNYVFQQMIMHNSAPRPMMTKQLSNLPDSLRSAGYTAIPRAPLNGQQFENKAWLRKTFNDSLPFPDFAIYRLSSLRSDTHSYHQVLAGREVIVLQSSSSSGGRGTYIVRNYADYQAALDNFRFVNIESEEIVISTFIPAARERSLQCCVSSQGILFGPLQKQIIGDDQIANRRYPNRSRFGGGDISPRDPLLPLYNEMKQYAATICTFLRTNSDYRGIVGIDYVVDQNGKIYVLEINPRCTGMTPLLTHLWANEGHLPSYLIHILENAHIPYSLTDTSLDISAAEGCMFELHSQRDEEWYLSSRIQPGIYCWDSTTKHLEFIRPSCRLESITNPKQVLIEFMTPRCQPILPGRRVMRVLFRQSMLDEYDHIMPEARAIISAIYALAEPDTKS